MSPEPQFMEAAFKMLAGLVIVTGLILAFWYVARKYGRQGGELLAEKPIRVLANSCIGIKKHISLVQVPGTILVLGITQDRITCLTQIDGDAWQEAVAAGDRTGGEPATFMAQLKKEMAGFRRNRPMTASPSETSQEAGEAARKP